MRTLLLSIACGLWLASSAGVQADPPPGKAPAAAGQSETHVHATRAKPRRECIRSTGSHIPPDAGKCLPVPGSVYMQHDIESTGQVNAGAALRQLDPRIH